MVGFINSMADYNNLDYQTLIDNEIYSLKNNLTANQRTSLSEDPVTRTGNEVRVLVVDDLDSVRESLKIILSLEDDIKVVGEAKSGPEAVEQARILRPDVVLMDVEMPDSTNFDGIEACLRIKNEKLAPSVLMLTIHVDSINRQRANNASCDAYLEKGLNSRELVNLIRQFGHTRG